MAVQQDIPRSQRRQVFQVVHMAVSGIDQTPAHRQHGVIGQDGEIQHHLVHLGVAVASHAEQLLLQAVQKRDDLFGRVALRQVVAGAVVQKVAQQQQAVSPFPLEGFDHLAAVKRRPMQVRRDHPFHGMFSLL